MQSVEVQPSLCVRIRFSIANKFWVFLTNNFNEDAMTACDHCHVLRSNHLLEKMKKWFVLTNLNNNGVDLDICIISMFSNDVSCARIKDKCKNLTWNSKQQRGINASTTYDVLLIIITFRDFCREEAVLEKSYVISRMLTSTRKQQNTTW